MTSMSKSAQSKAALASPLDLNTRRQQLKQWMQRCRESTLKLFAGLDRATFCGQAHPEFSPVGWHLGHIAFTESLWLLERQRGLAPLYPQYRRLFAADGLPKAERANLPSFAEICDYLAAIRDQVWDYLAIAPLDQEERLWRWLLQHESQHCETITLLLQLHGHFRQPSQSAQPIQQSQNSDTQSLEEMVCIPAGYFEQGNESLDAIDNERPAHQVYLDDYWIDRYPVTCGQYRRFIAAGGYRDRQWWSEAGWQWLQANPVEHPLYWSPDPQWNRHPVCGVSWYEAEAYARFVNKRLPTEAEWEKAASWQATTAERYTYPWGEPFPTHAHCNHDHSIGHTTPVDAYAQGQSPYGCYDMLGNVWEWTASWFEGYAGFEPYLYRGYSQIYFDGEHRVLRGSSWATRPWAMRCAFRNWYHPHVRQILAGFRCARDSKIA